MPGVCFLTKEVHSSSEGAFIVTNAMIRINWIIEGTGWSLEEAEGGSFRKGVQRSP
jgi:hypothetical protein